MCISWTQEIIRFESPKRPYEGHFLHSQTGVSREKGMHKIPAGTIVIPTNQARRNFIVSVLNPTSEDSYFNWNFFDSYVQQKEYFSAYVFEDIAAELLANDAELAKEFNEKKRTDQQFASDPDAQLRYIYMHSAYYEESTANLLPVREILPVDN